MEKTKTKMQLSKDPTISCSIIRVCFYTILGINKRFIRTKDQTYIHIHRLIQHLTRATIRHVPINVKWHLKSKEEAEETPFKNIMSVDVP